jgi:hypothetical protein
MVRLVELPSAQPSSYVGIIPSTPAVAAFFPGKFRLVALRNAESGVPTSSWLAMKK